MGVEEFLADLRQRDLRVHLEGDRLRCSARPGALTPEVQEELRRRKPEIVDFLRRNAAPAQRPAIEPVPRTGPMPLSLGQQRLWFLHQLEPESAAFNIPARISHRGKLDAAVLDRVMTEMVRRHEVLRTTFVLRDGEPVQVIAPAEPVHIPLMDLRSLQGDARDGAAEEEVVAESRRPFDLERGPVWRARLLQKDEEDYIFLFTMHHIVCDRWSLGVFFRELEALEHAIVAGRPSPLPELRVQYADYAVWQRQWLQGEVLESHLAYWREQLGGTLPVLDLPTDRQRPALQTYRSASCPVAIPSACVRGLAALSQRCGATLYMTLLAVFKVLLFRYTGQDDVIVGTPVSSRSTVETERLIGFFINTLALRSRLDGRESFRSFLGRVRDVAMGAYAHQEMPFEKLVEALQPERDLSRAPLFQVMFVLQNVPKRVDVTGITTLGFTPTGSTTHDLSLDLGHTEDGLAGFLDYNVDLFDPGTIARFLEHYQSLLDAVVADPEQRLWDLPLFSTSQRDQMLREMNRAAASDEVDRWVHERIEMMAAQAPDRVAVVMDEATLTYGQLSARAGALANALAKAGVRPGDRVVVLVERSVGMVVALLAVFKAGAAFVPADPATPAERLAYLVGDSGARWVITTQDLSNRAPANVTKVMLTDIEGASEEAIDVRDAEVEVDAAHLAYIIYTSGSTGQPKGVMVSHGAIRDHIQITRRELGLGPEDCFLEFSSLSFDAALEDILCALTSGARLVLRGPEVWLPSEFPERVKRHGLTIVDLPTAYWEQLARHWAETKSKPDAGPLRTVGVGGDAMTVQAVAWWRQTPWKSVRLLNAYGPTEGVITSTFHVIQEGGAGEGRVSIGRPLPGKPVYVLDPAGGCVPPGVVGELCVGGSCLATGYWARPDLTAERFVPDPFRGEPGARYYRTGDRARFMADGTLEFLGRTDDQVKIRGYRVEPGEVEAVLHGHAEVQDGAVLVRADGSGDRHLVAYVVRRPGAELTQAGLEDYLGERLPEYLMPSAVVFLDALPYNHAGKVDRLALPAPDFAAIRSPKVLVAPRDPLELQLSKIWEQVLGRSPVGITENFFEAGGHSLMAVTLFSRIERVLGRHLPLVTLYQDGTIERQAAILRQEGWQPPWASLVPLQPGGSRPPFFIVHGVGGNILWCRDLVRRLGSDQPCYGIQAQGLDPDKAVHNRVEAMAAHYLNDLRSLQPAGPYYLGGFCMGGMIAYEMARQLEAAGERVGMLALMEAHGPAYFLDPQNDVQYFYEHRTLFQRVMINLGKLRSMAPAERGALLRQKLAMIRERMGVRLGQVVSWALLKLGHRTLAALHRVHQANIDAQISYQPSGRLRGRVDLWRCEKQPLGDYTFDPLFGWGPFVESEIRQHEVPGWHSTLLHEPYVSVFAEDLNNALREAHEASLRHRESP